MFLPARCAANPAALNFSNIAASFVMSAVATCASCYKRLAWVTRHDRFLQFTLDGAGEKFVTARSKGCAQPRDAEKGSAMAQKPPASVSPEQSEAIAATGSTMLEPTETTPEHRDEVASKLVNRFAIWLRRCRTYPGARY
jgi:hypothetical protein